MCFRANSEVVENAVLDSPWNGAIPLSNRQLTAVINEQIYFEIPSVQYTTGEIRGQIRRISQFLIFFVTFSENIK